MVLVVQVVEVVDLYFNLVQRQLVDHFMLVQRKQEEQIQVVAVVLT
jgi:hypothetical protein